MTGHFTNDRRPGGVPDPDGDAALDAAERTTAQTLLAALQVAIDVDAGLAAVRAAAEASADPPARHPRGTEEAGGELGAICRALAEYLADLDPASDSRTSTPKGLGGSVLYLGAVHRLLQELRYGLLGRTLDRDSAERLLRLVEHNAAEAGHLLAGERHRSTRRIRPLVDAWVDVTAGVRVGVAALRPRILRLFDDAGRTAPHAPAPQLPV